MSFQKDINNRMSECQAPRLKFDAVLQLTGGQKLSKILH